MHSRARGRGGDRETRMEEHADGMFPSRAKAGRDLHLIHRTSDGAHAGMQWHMNCTGILSCYSEVRAVEDLRGQGIITEQRERERERKKKTTLESFLNRKQIFRKI